MNAERSPRAAGGSGDPSAPRSRPDPAAMPEASPIPRGGVVNFGGNVTVTPRRLHVPGAEAELLAILDAHADGRVRVVGARHAWSDAIVSDDVLVDLHRFRSIRLEERDGGTVAWVGGGCRIKALLAALNERGLTTPSVGLVTEQTIAGAISTATHGSGRHSLSHYVVAVRVACFPDPGGPARVVEISDGPELRAARCALGCLGVIVEVALRCVPQYFVREKVTPCASIGEVLALGARSPLQQFFFVPHRWGWYAQERAVAERNARGGAARLYRAYWFLTIDLGLHLAIKACASALRSRRLTRFFFRRLLPGFLFPRWVVTDRSDRMLVMEHELFRHLEMELFVPEERIGEAAAFVESVLRFADDRAAGLPNPLRDAVEPLGLLGSLDRLGGSFTSHYAVCFRKVLRDDALIATTARGANGGSGVRYAMSFITYVEPREPFYRLARFLGISMAALFDARPHWGKWFPPDAAAAGRSYPDLAAFRAICARFDPRGTFRNDFVNAALGFDAAAAATRDGGRAGL